MKHLLTRPWWFLLLCCLIVSVLLELAVFKYKYWLQFATTYDRLVVVNSAAQTQETSLNKGPVLIDAAHNAVAFSVPDIKIRNIRLDIVHPNNPDMLVRGTIAVRTEESKYLYMRAGNFMLSTKHEALNNIVFPKEKVTHEVRVEFELPQGANFYLSSLIVNDDLKLAPSLGRMVLLFLPLAAVVLIFKYRLFVQVYEPQQHRLCSYCILIFNVGLVLSILLFNNTVTGLNTKSQCSFPQECTFDYGATPGSLLQKRPETYDERYNSNVYHQQFDAWLKGQTALDVAVHPRINDFADIYDQSEYYRAQVGWLFDHVIYKGQYYNYYGVAPLILVYAPVYALTGMFPTPILLNSILALMGVLASFWALSAVVRAYDLRPNLLLYLLAQMALPSMALLFFGQTSLDAAQQTCLAGYAMGLLLVASGTEMLLQTGTKRLALAVVCAVAVVLLVLSRPHILFVALLFFTPLVLQFIGRSWQEQEQEQEQAPATVNTGISTGVWANITANLKHIDLKASILFCSLVSLGALGVMYYNYVRFGGVANFGQNLMVTAAVNLPKYNASYDLPAVLEALYHAFLPTVHLNESFPFLEISEVTADDRSYYPFPGPTFGLLAFSANYALLLLLWRLPRAHNSWLRLPVTITHRACDPLRVMLCLVLAAYGMVAVFNTIWGSNLLTRYSLDAAWAAGLVSLILLLTHIKWQGQKSAVLLYLVVAWALLVSALVGYLLNFIVPTAFATQPLWFLDLYNLFRPFIVQG